MDTAEVQIYSSASVVNKRKPPFSLFFFLKLKQFSTKEFSFTTVFRLVAVAFGDLNSFSSL